MIKLLILTSLALSSILMAPGTCTIFFIGNGWPQTYSAMSTRLFGSFQGWLHRGGKLDASNVSIATDELPITRCILGEIILSH